MRKLVLSNFWSKKDMLNYSRTFFWNLLERLKRGYLISKSYKPSTIKRRAKYSLQTNHIDLVGNNRYSRKKWRLWNKIGIKAIDRFTAYVFMKDWASYQLYIWQIRRFGKFFEK